MLHDASSYGGSCTDTKEIWQQQLENTNDSIEAARLERKIHKRYQTNTSHLAVKRESTLYLTTNAQSAANSLGSSTK